jgi:hypothetical protein
MIHAEQLDILRQNEIAAKGSDARHSNPSRRCGTGIRGRTSIAGSKTHERNEVDVSAGSFYCPAKPSVPACDQPCALHTNKHDNRTSKTLAGAAIVVVLPNTGRCCSRAVVRTAQLAQWAEAFFLPILHAGVASRGASARPDAPPLTTFVATSRHGGIARSSLAPEPPFLTTRPDAAARADATPRRANSFHLAPAWGIPETPHARSLRIFNPFPLRAITLSTTCS